MTKLDERPSEDSTQTHPDKRSMRGQGAAIQPCNANVIRAGKIFGKKDSITYKVKTQERREYKGKKGKRVDMGILM
jgi:hypothetical protein